MTTPLTALWVLLCRSPRGLTRDELLAGLGMTDADALERQLKQLGPYVVFTWRGSGTGREAVVLHRQFAKPQPKEAAA
ncbi:MAG: hypothetical protein WD771_08785 [Gemmatimonadaceae bacterium]